MRTSYLVISLFVPSQRTMIARLIALACLSLGVDAFLAGAPLRAPARSGPCRTFVSMAVPADHPEIEVGNAVQLWCQF